MGPPCHGYTDIDIEISNRLCLTNSLSGPGFFHSQTDTINRIRKSNINKPTVQYQTVHLNDRRNKLFSYDNFGCWKTNLERVGVGLVMYSTKDIRSDVKNIGDPEKYLNVLIYVCTLATLV